MLAARGGLTSFLKEGAKHFSGLEESVINNIDATSELSETTRTSLGPNGMNKMVVNRHEKTFVTSDSATIVKEVDVVHPAAKMLCIAAEQQEVESGDGTNFVLTFSGALLKNAKSLINNGLYPSDIISGYSKAVDFAQAEIEKLSATSVEDIYQVSQVSHVMRAVISSKQHLYAEFLANLISEACIATLPPKSATQRPFVVENIRVCKVLGSGITDSRIVKGLVLTRDVAGSIRSANNAKVAVLATGIDIGKTETKGNVVLSSAKDLLDFSKGEEESIEQVVKAISDVGVKVVVSGGNISDIAMHYLERYGMLVFKTSSKFELQRICRATGANPLVRLGAPTAEELGSCTYVGVEEIGSTRVTIFRQAADESQVSTIIIRGATNNRMDDVERAIDDGVNMFKGMTRDNRYVAGGGSAEMELSVRLTKFADSCSGLEQHAIRKYGESFEVIARTIAENNGFNATEVVSNLRISHQKGNQNDGVDVRDVVVGKEKEGEEKAEHVADMKETGVFDHLLSKSTAIKLATEAAVTILRIDHIIMAKEAGGPRLPPQGARDSD